MGVGLHIVIVGSALREWSIQDDVAVIGRVEAIGRKIVLIELLNDRIQPLYADIGLFQFSPVISEAANHLFLRLLRYQAHKCVFVSADVSEDIADLLKQQSFDHVISDMMRSTSALDLSITRADHVLLLLR